MTHGLLPLRIIPAVPLVLVCHALVRSTPMPAPMAAAFAGFAVASALWPGACLVVLTGLVPVASLIASQWAPLARGSEAAVITFLTGAILRLLVQPPATHGQTRTVRYAAGAFALIVVASSLVELKMLQYATDFPGHFAGNVWRFFTRDFFADPGGFARLNDAVLLLEGTALAFCVTRFNDADGTVSRSILRITVVAATAAAALNTQRLVQITLQHGGGWHMLLALAPTMRISVLHTDVNAAGSYFAMTLPIAIALGAERRTQVGWLATAAAITIAIWLTGSRTAMAATGASIVGFLAAGIAIATSRRQRITMAVALVASIAIIAAAIVHYPQSRNTPTTTALSVRADMARAAVDMFKTRPVFGIGVGTFWLRSGAYIPARLKQTYAHENAHNNFLQILAELGIVGLAAFLAVIAAALLPLRRREGRDSLLALGALCGMVAFLLTCLAGHPLLTREAAYPFWLALGATAAIRAPRAADPEKDRSVLTRLRSGSAHLAMVAVLAATVPFRVAQETRTRDFENVAIGYSLWSTSDDGVRFRWAQARSRFFVAANTSYVLLPVRLGPGEPESSVVTVRLDGHVVNTVTVLRDRWTTARIMLAPGRFTPRYRMIELEVGGPEHRAAALMVGRPGV